jgi:Fe-coproporphyrin III synthase
MSNSAHNGEEISKIMRTPRSVDVEITGRCNLRCKYCYFFDNQAVNYIDLPTQEWLQFFNELGRCSVMEVCIAGGEPFIREDLPELLKGIVQNRMRFQILSNGSLINNKMAAFIANTCRCNSVQISIDGSNPDIHDYCRGKGSFKGAVRGIRILQQHKVPVTVRVTIHHHNVDDLENIARLLLDELAIKQFSTNSASALGTCRLNRTEVLLTPQDRIRAMETLLELNKEYEGRITATAGPLAEALIWSEMERARRNGDPPRPYGGRLTACGCTTSKIAVRSDGAFTPCPLLSHIELGRINQDSLTKVWQESNELNELRNRGSISLTDFEFCRNCPYIPYCTGNCPSIAHSITGKVNHPNPDSCMRSFIAELGKESIIDDLINMNPQPSCN